MQVRVMFLGPLGMQIGRETVDFELPDGSNYGDLLKEIGREYGPMFKEKLWDSEKNFFKGSVLVVGEGRDHEDRDILLNDNEEIKFVPLLVGG